MCTSYWILAGRKQGIKFILEIVIYFLLNYHVLMMMQNVDKNWEEITLSTKSKSFYLNNYCTMKFISSKWIGLKYLIL